MNKKAYYSYDDVGMFFLSFLVIIVGIIIGLLVFYSQNYDVRQEEAKIIANKLVRGIIDNEINDKVLSKDFNLFIAADLDQKIINNGEYFFRLEIYEQDKLIKTFVEGNRDLEIFCELKTKKSPGCFTSEYKYGNKKLKVFTASAQKGKNV